jgi:phosphatidylglycerophosphatase A
MLGVIFVISVFFSSVAECIYKKKDDRRIVIDEVAGVWFSIAFLPKTLGVLFFGFVLFRFFDIKKPFFIKRLQKLKSGLGITMDDVMAGIFVNIILRLIRGIL